MIRNKYIWFVPAIGVALGILALSTFLSFPVQVEGVSYIDKIQHCFAYFVLSLSLLIAFNKARLMNKRILWMVLLCSTSYGFLLELAQYSLFPNRFFEWIDAIANMLGALIGVGIYKLIYRA